MNGKKRGKKKREKCAGIYEGEIAEKEKLIRMKISPKVKMMRREKVGDEHQ